MFNLEYVTKRRIGVRLLKGGEKVNRRREKKMREEKEEENLSARGHLGKPGLRVAASSLPPQAALPPSLLHPKLNPFPILMHSQI